VIATLGQQDGETMPIAVNISGRSLECPLLHDGADDASEARNWRRAFSSRSLNQRRSIIWKWRICIFRSCARLVSKYASTIFGAGANSFTICAVFDVDFVSSDGAFVKAALQHSRDRK